MWVHEITLTRYEARCAGGEPLDLGTAGSKDNEQLQVTLGEGWEGLAVRAIWRPCKVAQMLPEDGLLAVPWEATEKVLPAGKGRIVFCGLAEDGRVLNSLDLPYRVQGHSPTDSREEKEYTPGVVEQIIQRVKTDAEAAQAAAGLAAQEAGAVEQIAQAAREDAETAQTAAGLAGQAAGTAKASAEEAEAALGQVEGRIDAAVQGVTDEAKQAAQDAAESAGQAAASAGRVDAALEELDGMLADGQVASVNGKTGRVTLTAADVGALGPPAEPTAGQALVVESVGEDGSVALKTAGFPVASVNGKTGVVVLTAADVGALGLPAAPVAGQALVVESVGEDGSVALATSDSLGGGFVLMTESIPTAERKANTLYFLVTDDHGVSV